MEAFAIAGVTLYLWRVSSLKTSLLFLAIVAFGVAYYVHRDEQRPCSERSWFCEFVPDRGIGFVGPPEYVDPCPNDIEPLTARVFQSDAANAEVHRLISKGMCQEAAIQNVANGWKATYDPNFGSWWQRLFF